MCVFAVSDSSFSVVFFDFDSMKIFVFSFSLCVFVYVVCVFVEIRASLVVFAFVVSPISYWFWWLFKK